MSARANGDHLWSDLASDPEWQEMDPVERLVVIYVYCGPHTFAEPHGVWEFPIEEHARFLGIDSDRLLHELDQIQSMGMILWWPEHEILLPIEYFAPAPDPQTAAEVAERMWRRWSGHPSRVLRSMIERVGDEHLYLALYPKLQT